MRVFVTGLVLCGSVAAAAAAPCDVTIVDAPGEAYGFLFHSH